MAPLASEIDSVVYKPSDDWTKLGPQNQPVDTTPVNGVLPPGIILIIVVSVVGAVVVSVIIAACVCSQRRKEKRRRNKALGRQQGRRWRWRWRWQEQLGNSAAAEPGGERMGKGPAESGAGRARGGEGGGGDSTESDEDNVMASPPAEAFGLVALDGSAKEKRDEQEDENIEMLAVPNHAAIPTPVSREDGHEHLGGLGRGSDIAAAARDTVRDGGGG